jgi:hypothetical protein
MRSPGTDIPDPLVFEDGSVLATSKQIAEHLLCPSCEDRFAVFDEYVSNLAYQSNGSSPVPELVPYLRVTRDQVVEAANLDAVKLLHFGLSVIWRAHICRTLNKVTLGPHAEGIRAYLLETAPLPERVHVVATWYQDEGQALLRRHLMDRVVVQPQMNRASSNHLHWFIVCGLKFEVTVGSHAATRSVSELCLHCRQPPRIWVQDPYESGMLEVLRSQARRAIPRGKYARFARRLQ